MLIYGVFTENRDSIECFSSQEKAIDYIVTMRFSSSKWPREELEVMAQRCIHVIKLDEKIKI